MTHKGVLTMAHMLSCARGDADTGGGCRGAEFDDPQIRAEGGLGSAASGFGLRP